MRDDLRWTVRLPRPAFEKRHDDPSRDYGIGSVQLVFNLIGEKGAISFEVSTGWYLPHVAERFRKEPPRRYSDDRFMPSSFEPSPAGVYWHSYTPMYEGQEGSDDCTLLDEDAKCFCDVGFSAGDELLAALIEGGEEGLRTLMEEWYARDLEARAVDPKADA